MRSELVFDAHKSIGNRFLLSATIMRAARKLHVDSTRTADTVNKVFAEVAKGRYIDVKLPVIVAPPIIDLFLVSPAA